MTTLAHSDRTWIVAALLAAAAAGVVVAWTPTGALAAMVGAVLFVALVIRPTLGLPLMYAMLLTSDVIPTGLNLVVPLTLSKMAMLGVTLAWFVRCVLVGKWPLRGHLLTLPMLITTGTLALGLVHSRVIDGDAIALVVGFGMVTAMIEVMVALTDPKDLRWALLGLALVHVVVVGLAIPFGHYPLENNLDMGSRNAGFAGDANYWALLVLIGLGPTVAILDNQKSAVLRWFAVIAVAVAGVSVVLTVSRSGFLLTMAMLPLLTAVLWRRKGLLAISLVVAVIAVYLFVDFGPIFDRFDALVDESEFEADGSLRSRTALLWYAIDIWLENPIFGIGTGSIRADLEVLTAGHLRKVPHNTYLNILAEQGIVGSLPFLSILVTTVYVVVRTWVIQRTRGFRTITLGFGASVVAYLVMAATLDMVVAAPVYFLLGIIVILGQVASRSPSELADLGLAEEDDPVVVRDRAARAGNTSRAG